jgi:hypothetical protein
MVQDSEPWDRMQPNSGPSDKIAQNLVSLYRPVGLRELALIWDSSFLRFPPGLPQQPYSSPVASLENATKIACEWNVHDEASVYCGFVTSFKVSSSNVSRFRSRVHGSSADVEYEIPPEKLEEFNHAIEGPIIVEAAFFGSQFEGYVPAGGELKGKNATEQFVELAKLWEYSSVEFASEVSRNRKSVYLNCWFWAQHEFSNSGVRPEQKLLLFQRLRNTWELDEIEISWPAEKLDQVLSKSVSRETETEVEPPRLWKNARSRAGGRVDDAVSDEEIDIQDEFRQSLKIAAGKLPASVGWLSVGVFLFAVYNLILFILAIVHPELYRTGDPDRDTQIAYQVAFLAPARTALAAIFGYGLLNLEQSARTSLLFFAGLDLCRGLLSLILPAALTRTLTVSRTVTMVFCIVVILCLTTKKARLAFENTPQGPWSK